LVTSPARNPFAPTGSGSGTSRSSGWQVPRLDPSDRWIGGVAAGIAREVGVEPTVIRVSFVLLALAGGWGLVLYALTWIVLAVKQPANVAGARHVPEPKAASAFHRYLAVAMIVLGLILAASNSTFFVANIVYPAGFVVTGFLVAWTRHRNDDGLSAVLRILMGVTIGLGGMVAFITLSTANLIDALLVMVLAFAIVAGVGLVAAPSIARIGSDLDEERQSRVRADERARVAAHLHDSVLQTLALIQRHADDPTRTAQLARHQERELRNWLYSSTTATTPGTVRLGDALDQLASEVDADHGVPVKVITVGDNSDLPEGTIDALVAATKEAAVNAAKHSGAKKVDVFAERYDDRIEIFVRDTGNGFDPADTAADRRGISESILGRMERAGGTAVIHSDVGAGTEVELVLPLEAAPDASPDQPPNEQPPTEQPPNEKEPGR